MFFSLVFVLPMLGLLIMNDQLTEANSITGATSVETVSGDTQIFAGLFILALVLAGLVSLFIKFHGKVKVYKEKKKVHKLTEKIKKL